MDGVHNGSSPGLQRVLGVRGGNRECSSFESFLLFGVNFGASARIHKVQNSETSSHIKCLSVFKKHRRFKFASQKLD